MQQVPHIGGVNTRDSLGTLRFQRGLHAAFEQQSVPQRPHPHIRQANVRPHPRRQWAEVSGQGRHHQLECMFAALVINKQRGFPYPTGINQ